MGKEEYERLESDKKIKVIEYRGLRGNKKKKIEIFNRIKEKLKNLEKKGEVYLITSKGEDYKRYGGYSSMYYMEPGINLFLNEVFGKEVIGVMATSELLDEAFSTLEKMIREVSKEKNRQTNL